MLSRFIKPHVLNQMPERAKLTVPTTPEFETVNPLQQGSQVNCARQDQGCSKNEWRRSCFVERGKECRGFV